MTCLVHHWFPDTPVTNESMGEALYMEQRYWENMKNAVAAGISEVL